MLTEEQRQIAKNKILEMAKISNEEWVQRMAYNIEHNLPVQEDRLEVIYNFTMFFDSMWGGLHK